MAGSRHDITHVRTDAKVEDFLQNVLNQVGDRYQRGAEAHFDDADPDAFDGSELVEWAANRAGVVVNDGAANQFRQMSKQGGELSVDDALGTPGAVLYEFTGDPAHPTRASTAISLGDGRIVDIDPVEGVRIVDAKDFHFTHAVVMPGFVDAKDPAAGTADVIAAAYEKEGLEPASLPSVTAGMEIPPPPEVPKPPEPPVLPDSPEIDALAHRAAELRARHVEELTGGERVQLEDRGMELGRDALLAKEAQELARYQVDDQTAQAKALRAEAAELRDRARQAKEAGRDREAEELSEEASQTDGLAGTAEHLAQRAQVDLDRFTVERTGAEQAQAAVHAETQKHLQALDVAESNIDKLDDQVRLLRDAAGSENAATNLEQQASLARAGGDTERADALTRQATEARSEAKADREAAAAIKVDEKAIEAGLDYEIPAKYLPPAVAVSAADTAAIPPAPPAGTSAPDAHATSPTTSGSVDPADLELTSARDLEVARELLDARRVDHQEDAARVERLERREADLEDQLRDAAPDTTAITARYTEIKDKLGEHAPADDLVDMDGNPRVKGPEEMDPLVRAQLREELAEVEAVMKAAADAGAPIRPKLDAVREELHAAKAEAERSRQALDEQQGDVDHLEHPISPLAPPAPAAGGPSSPAATEIAQAAKLGADASAHELSAERDRLAASDRRELSDLRDERAGDLQARADAAAAREADVRRQATTANDQAQRLSDDADRYTREAKALEDAGDASGATAMRDRATETTDQSVKQMFAAQDLDREADLIAQQAVDDKAAAVRLAHEADVLDAEAAARDARAAASDAAAKAARDAAVKLEADDPVLGASAGDSLDGARAVVAASPDGPLVDPLAASLDDGDDVDVDASVQARRDADAFEDDATSATQPVAGSDDDVIGLAAPATTASFDEDERALAALADEPDVEVRTPIAAEAELDEHAIRPDADDDSWPPSGDPALADLGVDTLDDMAYDVDEASAAYDLASAEPSAPDPDVDDLA
jgi:hypothetical protein